MSEKSDVERLSAFTDGVIVVAMTLLVLDIRLPRPAGALDDRALLALLLELTPNYFAYALSFVVIATFWLSHRIKFRFIRRIDRVLMWLNMAFLLFIGAIPFVTSVISENAGAVATAVYAGVMTICALLLAVIWWVADRRKLLDETLSAPERMMRLIQSLLGAAVFAVSIGLAFVSPNGAKYFWLMLIPISASDRWMRRKA